MPRRRKTKIKADTVLSQTQKEYMREWFDRIEDLLQASLNLGRQTSNIADPAQLASGRYGDVLIVHFQNLSVANA
ncbi:LOW QUALITY PROTEIN: hypothetical protein CVT25_010610 [Psilocybe cyanescens]|uniref:Uncharacterized protein n=1 Tax=Psilocybe cyanescens TaxID=93625 RepID=A0A409XUU6_PSICY|nr:LOW QUALITY PROTEIN: hypothetical protein CVT25_010610 [Psilocybe cyanescens]